MNQKEQAIPAFFQSISLAAKRLRSKKLEEAYSIILEAISVNPSAAQPHNLLGIWFELKGNPAKARKHYRAAYALDPTYRPACKNLHKICIMSDFHVTDYDYGDEYENEEICQKGDQYGNQYHEASEH